MTTVLTHPGQRSDAALQPADAAAALWAGASVPPMTFATIRRRAVLDGCKWDPQVGDKSSLSPFPLVMKSSVWQWIASRAEQLAAEAIAAEEEISHRPELLKRLGYPRALRRVLTQKTPLTPGPCRVMRFDFHQTTDGWRISEVNSDVPGGFTEASCFTAMMAEFFPRLRPSGDPAAAWTEVLAAVAGPVGHVALLSAPGYMEDQQVTAFLAGKLRQLGCRASLAKPEQIFWRDGWAELHCAWYAGPVDLIVRFYQAEWLSRFHRNTGWHHFFRGGKTPVANPPLAVISESKRFPLVWDKLSTDMSAWRALLPETRDPRDAPWPRDDSWLLKTAMCNTGDTVSHRSWMLRKHWRVTALQARLFPGNWVAQRRFQPVPIRIPHGPRHACIGVYTVNGRASGVYARISDTPVIDFAATDVALLLEADE